MNIVDRKLMELRKAAGITRAVLAEAMHTSASKVSNVENGKAHFDDDEIRLAMEYFGMVGAPLAEDERIHIKGRLDVMRTHVRERRFAEAEAIRIELRCLASLEPCDLELAMTYLLSEAHVFLFTEREDAAEERLKHVHNHLKQIDPKNQYYFYCSMGALHHMRERYKDSLDCCIKALDLSESNNDFLPDNTEKPRLLGNIALCYTELYYPCKALLYSKEARMLYPEKRADELGLTLDLTFASNCIRINVQYEAEKALRSCRGQAYSLKDNHFIGLSMFYSGLRHKISANWKRAIAYFDKSLKCYSKDSAFYFAAIHQKILCLIDSREFAKAKRLIPKVQKLYREHKVYSIYIESTWRYWIINKRKTLKNEEAVEYIKTVTIPHLLKNGDFFAALVYYKLLEEHLDKIGNPTKSLEISRAILKIHQRCLLEDERSLFNEKEV